MRLWTTAIADNAHEHFIWVEVAGTYSSEGDEAKPFKASVTYKGWEISFKAVHWPENVRFLDAEECLSLVVVEYGLLGTQYEAVQEIFKAALQRSRTRRRIFGWDPIKSVRPESTD